VQLAFGQSDCRMSISHMNVSSARCFPSSIDVHVRNKWTRNRILKYSASSCISNIGLTEQHRCNAYGCSRCLFESRREIGHPDLIFIVVCSVVPGRSPWWWRQKASPKLRYNSTRLHGVTAQRTVIFKLATVRARNYLTSDYSFVLSGIHATVCFIPETCSRSGTGCTLYGHSLSF
jgi:hypothetical protein